jgi:hypothetical protein
MRPQQTQPLGDRVVLSRDDASLGRRDDLHCMKAENAGVRKLTPDRPAAVLGSGRVRRILQHFEPVVVGQRADLAKLAWQPREIDRYHDLRKRSGTLGFCELRLQQLDGHATRRGIDIDEAHLGTAVQGTVCRRDEAVRARPDPRPGSDVEREASNVQRRGGVAHGDRSAGAM